MVSRFPGATPEVIWIVGVLKGQGTHLSFPGSSDEVNISFSMQDENQEVLDLFDQLGFRVWLQVEPGDTKVETLFDWILPVMVITLVWWRWGWTSNGTIH
jgi:hypothetical protein